MFPARTEQASAPSATAALAAVLLLAACIISSSAKAHHSESFQPCGSVPEQAAWQIRAKHVGCESARQVVRRYGNVVAENGPPWTRQIGDFRCKITGGYGDGVYMRCAADNGHREIRFARGG